MSDTNTRRSVFVVHGRNQKARNAMFEFLRALDLHPIEWSEAIKATKTGTPHISTILDHAFSMARAIVVLFTPDDEARLRPGFRSKKDPPYETQLTGQARPNVLFEAGLAMGRDSERTIMVEVGDLRPFSDISGRHIVRLDESSEKRHDLASRLEAAGCAVNRDGTDWLGAGRFDSVTAVEEELPEPRGTYLAPSDAAADMLHRACAIPQGEIRRWQDARGKWHIAVGLHEFDMGDARAAARSTCALEDLIGANMVGTHEVIKDVEWVHKVTERGFRWIDDDRDRRRRSSPSHSLSEEAWDVLRAAVGSNGEVMRFASYGGGPIIKAGGRAFNTGSPRSAAKWDGAIDELTASGLLKKGSGSMLSVTREGYRMVERDSELGETPANRSKSGVGDDT